MRKPEQQELVAELAADFPLFAPATIARWVAHEAARYPSDAVGLAGPVGRAVRATLLELSREGVATADELPVARSLVVDAPPDVSTTWSTAS